MNTCRRHFASLVVLSLVLAAPAAATDYWVKNGGNDGTSGLSPAAAWATLDHAADVAVLGTAPVPLQQLDSHAGQILGEVVSKRGDLARQIDP